jgi:Rrf2 family protein
MPVNTQFSIAVHLMAGLGLSGCSEVTSTKLAGSVNTSPSFVRRILAKLSKAKLISTTMGKTGSCALAKDPREISLLDIYHAVDAPKTFAIHDYPEQKACMVSCNIRSSMMAVLDKTQESVEKSLAEIKLADVMGDLQGT